MHDMQIIWQLDGLRARELRFETPQLEKNIINAISWVAPRALLQSLHLTR